MAALTEAVCAVWDDERDTVYFRIVADVFTPAFTLGATVLLASYDDECGAQAAVISVYSTPTTVTPQIAPSPTTAR